MLYIAEIFCLTEGLCQQTSTFSAFNRTRVKSILWNNGLYLEKEKIVWTFFSFQKTPPILVHKLTENTLYRLLSTAVLHYFPVNSLTNIFLLYLFNNY